MTNEHEFEATIKRQDEARRRAELRDLSDEQSGRETGRIARHLPKNATGDDPKDPKRKRAEAVRRFLDQLLLTDPVYRSAYQMADARLTWAETLTENTIGDARLTLEKLERSHEELLDRASQLPDGTRVFQSEDGRTFDEFGREVSQDTAAAIVWRADSPSYAAFRHSRKAVETAESELDALVLYQVDVLGYWRDRLEDHDAPPSQDELAQLMEDLLDRAPQAIKPQLEAHWEAPASDLTERDANRASKEKETSQTVMSRHIDVPDL